MLSFYFIFWANKFGSSGIWSDVVSIMSSCRDARFVRPPLHRLMIHSSPCMNTLTPCVDLKFCEHVIRYSGRTDRASLLLDRGKLNLYQLNSTILHSQVIPGLTRNPANVIAVYPSHQVWRDKITRNFGWPKTNSYFLLIAHWYLKL